MIYTLNDLIKASSAFSIPDTRIELKERGRHEFISKFPFSSIQNLKIDDYCIGTNDNSFCYWLEFKEILFGIGGGNASKFGIYKSKDGNYYEGYGPKKVTLNGSALEDKFSTLKDAIIQCLKFVEKNEIEKISSLQIPIWNMVMLKIFCIYFPNKFLTIGDPEVIIECAKNIGILEVELKNENSIWLNYLCRKKLNETNTFLNWEYEKLGAFIWQTFKPTSKRDYYIIGSKYGGKNDNDVFPEMFRKSVVATGFASNLDLSELYNENHNVIKEFLKAHDEDSNSIYALKHFLSLKPGDLIAVKADGSPKGTEGYLSIIGIAEVNEKNGKVYEYDPKGLSHNINVKYLNAPIFREHNLGGYGRTIHKLSNDDHINLIFKTNFAMSFFEELNKFLSQANTNELKTSHYIKKYLGLNVKVSFGQGNQSKIPWIAFLNEIDSVQQGIYPVYLFYKEKNLLILAYGISETHQPERKWNIENEQTIEQYFNEYKLGNPERYGNSLVFKSYDISQNLEENTINNDLGKLIEIYKSLESSKLIFDEDFQYLNFSSSASSSGLSFNDRIALRFTASLLTKPFVILTGLSGSGKTKLAQAFAMWICENEEQYCIVPVGADWTNREPLLGFPNALEKNDYKPDEYGILRLIINATKGPNKPYFLILDEMNLSHVERYFADFLSVMESKNKISLHSGDGDWNGVPPEIEVPPNLFVVGTVNIDETTYMFSPKVLDRSNVIEFRVSYKEMQEYLEGLNKIDLEILKYRGSNMATNFVSLASDYSLKSKDKEKIVIELMKFFSNLQKTGAEFGYRSANEILRFAAIINILDSDWRVSDIVDTAIMQKLLPKVHGSKRKLEPILKTLASLCLEVGQKLDDFLKTDIEIDFLDVSKIKYPLSLEKILRMLDNLKSNGFTSYAEA